jgi:hypothetical protein
VCREASSSRCTIFRRVVCRRLWWGFGRRRCVSQSALRSERIIRLYQGHLQSIEGFIDWIAALVKPSVLPRVCHVSPFLVGRRTVRVSTRKSGGATEIYDIPRLTEHHMFLHMQQHEIAFSDDQEWSGDEEDALVHSGRGPAACTTTASDETKARTETKAAVKMVYMVKQTCVKGFYSNSPSFYT